jgi:hypothetical protein
VRQDIRNGCAVGRVTEELQTKRCQAKIWVEISRTDTDRIKFQAPSEILVGLTSKLGYDTASEVGVKLHGSQLDARERGTTDRGLLEGILPPLGRHIGARTSRFPEPIDHRMKKTILGPAVPEPCKSTLELKTPDYGLKVMDSLPRKMQSILTMP